MIYPFAVWTGPGRLAPPGPKLKSRPKTQTASRKKFLKIKNMINVEPYIPFAEAVGMKLKHQRHLLIEHDELLAIAKLGLVEAAFRFHQPDDVEEGKAFRSFAWIRIRGAIIDFVRQELGRRITNKKPKMQSIEISALPTFIDDIEKRLSDREQVAKLLPLASPAQQRLLRLRYLEGWTAKEIIAVFGYTESSIHTQVSLALKRIRERAILIDEEGRRNHERSNIV